MLQVTNDIGINVAKDEVGRDEAPAACEATGEDEESEFGVQGRPPIPTGGGGDHHLLPEIALAIQCLATAS